MLGVVHFEIGADEPERAAKFYTAVFGWKIAKWTWPPEAAGAPDYWTVMTHEKGEMGINGGLMKRPMPAAGEGFPTAFICTIAVPDIDEYVAKITANGGKIHVPKMEVPGIGWLAYLTDTEGNHFGIIQMTNPMPR